MIHTHPANEVRDASFYRELAPHPVTRVRTHARTYTAKSLDSFFLRKRINSPLVQGRAKLKGRVPLR